ncbi:MAG: hypothetical protein ACK4TF_07610 [Thermodesulfovibrionales bacterium]
MLWKGDEKEEVRKEIPYKNKYLYFIIRPIDDRICLYCSGVNISRFLPVTRGRHRLGQNPVEKGLQSVNYGVRSLLISKGSIIKSAKGNLCPDVMNKGDDLWYTESFMIEDCSPELASEVINYAVLSLLKKIFTALMLDEKIPERLTEPFEMENYLENLCKKYTQKEIS